MAKNEGMNLRKIGMNLRKIQFTGKSGVTGNEKGITPVSTT
jgi:hypothetical protein